MKTTSIILAGGRNTRLGQNKALLKIGGQTMIDRVMERLSPLTERFLVVTAPDQRRPVTDRAETVTDVYPGSGPLGGIFTGLTASESELNIVVACDMPFLNIRLLEYMFGLAAGVDAVVPRLNEKMYEPLHAVYSRSCLEKMKWALEKGKFGVSPFYSTVRVRFVSPEESRRIDPDLLSFFNINFPEDLEKAIALDASGR